jgi:hypothetical protein
MRLFHPALIVAGVFFAAAPACAQPKRGQPAGTAPDGAAPAAAAQPAEAERERVTTRVYDVRDLLMTLKQYPFRGSMMSSRQTGADAAAAAAAAGGGGGGGGLYQAPQPEPAPPAEEGKPARRVHPSGSETPAEREASLTSLITETVAPDSWRDAGGNVGSMRVLGGHLVITQTQENHQLIQQLFSQFRETRARMVRVSARWLLMSPAQAEKLLGPGRTPHEAALRPVDTASLPQDVVQYRAQTVGFNTQTVHVVSGPARTVVSDVDAQVGTGVAAFDPVVELVRSGLVLEVTPLIAADNQYATVDLYSAFVDTARDGKPIAVRNFAATQPSRNVGRPAESGGDLGTDAYVDRLSTTMQELRTTIQVPLNQPVLVGGMTLDPNLSGQALQQMYLVVEVVASE